MPISALVITLSHDESLRAVALRELQTEPSLTLGPSIDRRLAAVLETGSSEESIQQLEALNSKPGVSFIDITSIHFEDLEQDHGS